MSIDCSPTTKTMNDLVRLSFSRCVAVSDVALCRARSFAGADDVATSCLPCWDLPCSLWAVDGSSAWWFMSMRRDLSK